METRATKKMDKDKEKESSDDTLGSCVEKLENTILEQNSKIEKHIAEMFEAINMIQLNGPSAHTSRPPHRASSASSPIFIDSETGRRTGIPNTYVGVTRLAKLDFPRFGGDRVKEWLFKVEQFFAIDHTPDELKVPMVSIHLDGVAATWHQSLNETEMNMIDWPMYKLLLKERFEEVWDDPIAELKKLQETEGIVNYHNQFENIRSRVNLSEAYLVSAYLAGLRVDTQMHVRMFQPQTVRQCLLLGCLYETAHPQSPFNSWNSTKPTSKGSLPFKKDTEQHLPKSVFPDKPTASPIQPRKFLSTEEMNERRAKGLCYFCDEPYTPGHSNIHKKAQLFVLDMEEEGEIETGDIEKENHEPEGEIAQISVNAISGISDYNTMRVKGVYQKRSLFILIASGSTHNFIAPQVADKLGCTLLSGNNAWVRVADGNRLKVHAKITKLQWDFHGTRFVADFMVIPLTGCDTVLGIQWLQTLGPITWDFSKLTMKFDVGQRKVVIHGIHPDSVRAIKVEKLNKVKEETIQLSMLCVTSEASDNSLELSVTETGTAQESLCPSIACLLDEYSDIFAEPQGLPPFRAHHNHKIQLIDGANPVSLRPYRYAIHQKTEIDKMVPAMLDCFLIPLLDDLMDELGGSQLYSKIALRAGYHQLRMDPTDVHKTAFQTHSGHLKQRLFGNSYMSCCRNIQPFNHEDMVV